MAIEITVTLDTYPEDGVLETPEDFLGAAAWLHERGYYWNVGFAAGGGGSPEFTVIATKPPSDELPSGHSVTARAGQKLAVAGPAVRALTAEQFLATYGVTP